MCSAAAGGGHLEVLQWAERKRMPVGCRNVCERRLREAIWRCCSGLEKTDARGMNTRVWLRLEEAIWRCCSGPEKTDALGMKTRIGLLLEDAIGMCCNGPELTDALLNESTVYVARYYAVAPGKRRHIAAW